jgi:hypothetical protein
LVDYYQAEALMGPFSFTSMDSSSALVMKRFVFENLMMVNKLVTGKLKAILSQFFLVGIGIGSKG